MKIHLAWIRMTAAAALAAGVGVHPAAAQYAPYHPAPPQPAAPQAAPAPANPYVAYRAPVAQQPVFPQGTAPRYQSPAMTYQQPAPAYQQPVYQQPAAAYQQPAAAYRPQPVAYPQTAMAHYPATYGGTPYVAQQPTEATLPPPQQATQTTAPVAETTMPAEAAPVAAPAAGGYPAAGCNCGGGGYSAGSYYGGGAAGCGCNTGCPDLSSYMGNDCCNDNIWFGGVYYLYMDRDRPSDERLAVEIETGTVPYPYYPPSTTTVVSTANVNDDFRSGVEVRFGCTFSVGDACNSGCGCGSGYPYAGGGAGCGCGGCNTCSMPTTYGWEFVWWGLDDSPEEYIRQDQVNTRIYGTKSFAGIEYDRDGAGGAYAYRPMNDYYDYQMPINAPPGSPPNGYTSVLAQRVWNNFRAQNFEINILRFPMCDTCGYGGGGGGCGCNTGCGCGGDACGCGTTGCGCCDDSWRTNFSMYGSCGVRYFRIDDDFAYDVEFTEWVGGAPDQASYNGFTFDNSNEICYDINVDNNLIGPQLGWTTNYCIGCRWNLFCNSTFGIFDNHISQRQRIWTGGDGAIRFANSTDSVNVHSTKDDVAFLGELRVGGSYDMTCHWRAVLAYRAVALTGIATSTGQIPDNFSDESDLARINSDNSMIIHGVQIGTECRY